jgi:hypothetical protein
MLNKRNLWFAVLLTTLLASSNLWASSTLHIGPGAGTACATGCAGDPNLLAGARTVDIYQTSAGASMLSQPVRLILGVPSQFDHLMPAMPITGVQAINAYPNGTKSTGTAAFAAGGTYGLIDPVSDGFFGTMGPGQEVYSFLGLGGANNSNSFTNWSAEDAEYTHLNVTGFDIHVYALNADLGPGGSDQRATGV